MNKPMAHRHYPVDRRTFLVAGGMSYFGMNLAHAAAHAATPAGPPGRRIAKSVIMIWLSGGASHIDTWDMKPNAVSDYSGPFRPIATSTPGISLCEHLPYLARQAHHLAIIRSLGDHGRGTGDHHAGYYYNLTGHAPDRTFHQLLNARTPYPGDWPSMASVVAAKRPPHAFLPNAITLPHKEGAPEYTRPGQFAARLGIVHEPVFVEGTRAQPLDFTVPALSLPSDVSAERMLARRDLLRQLDVTWRADGAAAGHARLRHPPAAGILPAGFPAYANGLRPAPRAGGGAGHVRARHQRHVDAAGPTAGRGRRALCDGVLEGRPRAGHAVQERRRLGHARQQLQLSQGPPAARVRPPLRRPARRPASARACWKKRWCWCRARWAASRASAIRVRAVQAARAAITGRRACRCCWPAAASAAARSTAPATPGPSIRTTTPSAPEHIARTVFHAMGIDESACHRP